MSRISTHALANALSGRVNMCVLADGQDKLLGLLLLLRRRGSS